jgi:hypothetical protein
MCVCVVLCVALKCQNGPQLKEIPANIYVHPGIFVRTISPAGEWGLENRRGRRRLDGREGLHRDGSEYGFGEEYCPAFGGTRSEGCDGMSESGTRTLGHGHYTK